jgi:thioredoxin reductase (NADPH)
MINRLEEGNIQVYYNAQIEEISESEIVVLQHEKEIRIKNDYVLALTGYQPNFDFLQKIGITLASDGKKKPFYKPETMETDRAGIYLAGVICGGMETHKWFIENSRVHAPVIMDAIKAEL